MAAAKEKIRQIISENNIFSVSDVDSFLKESFKDILQEFMEEELNIALGYEKTENSNEADLTVFNTCCVRENAEERLFRKTWRA